MIWKFEAINLSIIGYVGYYILTRGRALPSVGTHHVRVDRPPFSHRPYTQWPLLWIVNQWPAFCSLHWMTHLFEKLELKFEILHASRAILTKIWAKFPRPWNAFWTKIWALKHKIVPSFCTMYTDLKNICILQQICL